jgi:hypothetical protein
VLPSQANKKKKIKINKIRRKEQKKVKKKKID